MLSVEGTTKSAQDVPKVMLSLPRHACRKVRVASSGEKSGSDSSQRLYYNGCPTGLRRGGPTLTTEKSSPVSARMSQSARSRLLSRRPAVAEADKRLRTCIIACRELQRKAHEARGVVLKGAARNGAVWSRAVSCRIRPASRAVEWERAAVKRLLGAAACRLYTRCHATMHTVRVRIQGQGRCQGRERLVVEFWCGER
jgi:hypothetical protein